MSAMKRAGGPIIATFIMGVLTIFIFAIITYSLFRTDPDTDTPPCNTLYQCVGSTMLAAISMDSIAGIFHEEIWLDVPERFWEDSLLQVHMRVWAAQRVFVCTSCHTCACIHMCAGIFIHARELARFS